MDLDIGGPSLEHICHIGVCPACVDPIIDLNSCKWSIIFPQFVFGSGAKNTQGTSAPPAAPHAGMAALHHFVNAGIADYIFVNPRLPKKPTIIF
jgi:hypothetical protein